MGAGAVTKEAWRMKETVMTTSHCLFANEICCFRQDREP